MGSATVNEKWFAGYKEGKRTEREMLRARLENPDEALVEAVAKGTYEARNGHLRNCWRWDDSGLDDEHPGARAMYLREAQSAIRALARTLTEKENSDG